MPKRSYFKLYSVYLLSKAVISQYKIYKQDKMSKRTTIIKKLAYLGAAIREGQLSYGVERGPQLIRDSGVFRMLQQNYRAQVVDYGDIKLEQNEKSLHPPVQFAVRNLNLLGPLLGRLHYKIADIMSKKNEDLLLTIGGDHSIGAATVSGALRVHKDLKVVWIDAHTDCKNSHARTPHIMHNENYHGMPLSHVSGMTSIPDLPYWSWLSSLPFLDPKNIVLIGIRDLHEDEYVTMAKYGVKCYTMDHVDKFGIGEIMNRTIKYLDPNNEKPPFHLSFDVDAIDPEFMGQTGALCRYGLTGRESVHIVRRLVHETRLVSMDINQINEEVNKDQPKRARNFRLEGGLNEVSKSVGMGADLIGSLFTRYLEIQ